MKSLQLTKDEPTARMTYIGREQCIKIAGTAGSEAHRHWFGAAAAETGKAVSSAAAAAPATVTNRTASEEERSGLAAPSLSSSTSRRVVVVGCTMIDMHVSTKIDDHFKVSIA